MDRRFHESTREGLSSSSSSPVVNFENRISPSILLIIIILAIVFFISGILHLVVRLLLRPVNRQREDADTVTALQGQLQELFHLHDAGVDQSFIDALPVFLYKAIIGLKDPFDCAVCLCEFEADDRLRLLPKCSHAFHLECIDTWLLSHSTCPLCRRSLLPDFSPPASCSPVVLVLDSASESPRGTVSERRDTLPNGRIGSLGDDDFGPSINETDEKPVEINSKEESGNGMTVVASEGLETKVVPVKLGKFRSADPGAAPSGAVGEGTSSATGDLDQRRCFSMGSYEYVMDESTLLQVPIKPPKKSSIKKLEHRGAMSECDFHSRREGFKGLDAASIRTTEFRGDNSGNARISSNHVKESFSASKIWLRPAKKKSMGDDCSRRAFSFRLPLRWATSDESKLKKDAASPAATASEFNTSTWEKSSSEVDLDVEVGSSNYSVESRVDDTPSFARRTLLWLVGRQNKVGNHL